MKIYLIILLFVICACTDNDEKKSIPLQPISTNPPASTKQNWNEFGDNIYYDEKSIKMIQGITSTMLLINQPNESKVKSHLLKIEFNCLEYKMKIVLHSKYQDMMMSGRLISTTSNATGWLITRPRPTDKPQAEPPLLPLPNYMFLGKLVCAIEKAKASVKNQQNKPSK